MSENAKIAVGSGLAAVVAGVAAVFISPYYNAYYTRTHAFSMVVAQPKNGDPVSKKHGFLAKGSVDNFTAGENLYFLDRDDYGFTVDKKLSIDKSGSWTFTDAPLGDDDDKLPFYQTVAVIRGGVPCSDKVNTAPDGFLPDVPPDCVLVWETSVKVTRK